VRQITGFEKINKV